MLRHTKTLLFLFLVIFFHADCFGQVRPIKDLKPTVILISLDGFRYDYLDKYRPETLGMLARKGVRARWMIPSFPTKTFPNHYTVATGLYPANHGIIENNIYDAGFDAVFGLHLREEVQNARWWGGEPIWVTAERQGQRAAAFFFPGTEAAVKGVRPTFWKEYDGRIPNEERVDQILKWLDLPAAERPTVFTLYFSDTDDAGHQFSPDSPELERAVEKVDSDLRRLFDGLKKRGIENRVNLIITSDHGMATVEAEKYVLLDDYFELVLAERILWTGEFVQIFPKSGAEDEIMSGLEKIENASCWRKADIPERFKYRNNPRIAPIVCSADVGWYLTGKERLEELKKRPDWPQKRGAHGYDNQAELMRATFIAHGPAFKKGLVVEPFENIHVYNLMCRILNLAPAPNDGDDGLGKKILKIYEPK